MPSQAKSEEALDVPSVGGGAHANRWLLAVVGVVAIAGIAYLLKGRSTPAADAAKTGPGQRTIPVLVAEVGQRDVPVYLEGLGNVLPLATVTVKSQVDGRLDKVSFTEGQVVKKGDVLAQIDPRPFQIQLHQAEAAKARDEAQLHEAQRNLERYQTLARQHLIPLQQVDDQQANVDQFTGTVKADEAQVESARLNLDYARITSTVDGVTGVRLIDPGNIVHASDPTGIVVLTQLDPMAVLFTLPEDDLPGVLKQLAAGSVTVEAYSRDGSAKIATGQLALIDNQINTTTATMRLKAVFPNPDRSLWPNQFVKVRLLLQTLKDALVVPQAVVQRGPQGTFAYVVGPDDVASIRNLEVSATHGDWAVVANGLKAGERVVADGQNQLRPGAKVAPHLDKAGSKPSSPKSDKPQPAVDPPAANAP